MTLHGHHPDSLLSTIFPSRLPFEHIALVRQAFLSSSMALSQLGPLLFPPSEEDDGAAADPVARAQREAARVGPSLRRLGEAVAAAEGEVRAMQGVELRAVMGAAIGDAGGVAGVLETVKRGMEGTFGDLQVKGGEGTRGVWVAAVQRGRARAGQAMKGGLPSPGSPVLGPVKVEEGVEDGLSGPTVVGKEDAPGAVVALSAAEAASRLPTPPPDL